MKRTIMYNKNNELQAFIIEEDYEIVLYYEKLAQLWKCDKNDILVKDIEF